MGFSSGSGLASAAPQPPAPQGSRTAAAQLDSWIAVGADGIVTACTGKCELGQGLQTAQMQLIAEELAVSFDRAHAGPGHDVGQPVAPDKLQRAQSGAGVRNGA